MSPCTHSELFLETGDSGGLTEGKIGGPGDTVGLFTMGILDHGHNFNYATNTFLKHFHY